MIIALELLFKSAQ